MDKWVIYARYGIWGREETGSRNQEPGGGRLWTEDLRRKT